MFKAKPSTAKESFLTASKRNLEIIEQKIREASYRGKTLYNIATETILAPAIITELTRRGFDVFIHSPHSKPIKYMTYSVYFGYSSGKIYLDSPHKEITIKEYAKLIRANPDWNVELYDIDLTCTYFVYNNNWVECTCRKVGDSKLELISCNDENLVINLFYSQLREKIKDGSIIQNAQGKLRIKRIDWLEPLCGGAYLHHSAHYVG